jgi:hypothetical protein
MSDKITPRRRPTPSSRDGLQEAVEKWRHGMKFAAPTPKQSIETTDDYLRRLCFEQGWHAALGASK